MPEPTTADADAAAVLADLAQHADPEAAPLYAETLDALTVEPATDEPPEDDE